MPGLRITRHRESCRRLFSSGPGPRATRYRENNWKRHEPQPPVGHPLVVRKSRPLRSPAPARRPRLGPTFSLAIGGSAEPRHHPETRTIELQIGQGFVPDPHAGRRLALRCMSTRPCPGPCPGIADFTSISLATLTAIALAKIRIAPVGPLPHALVVETIVSSLEIIRTIGCLTYGRSAAQNLLCIG
jgi:hypothetical protein